eukprot:CAMPEP_0197932912 /NCGR_PEP_ID=MMETSP1439-20131203/109317_1 /TAXON_ID=66791 /ORGANISM="Gonyaulax spinifera, Strain CCMP409" /LENGTH=89 /DNA_ID=CAMNT_0043555717 /DNA_START=90 /DNA_END=357 /DNA_ORIENTATION=+
MGGGRQHGMGTQGSRSLHCRKLAKGGGTSVLRSVKELRDPLYTQRRIDLQQLLQDLDDHGGRRAAQLGERPGVAARNGEVAGDPLRQGN